MVFSFSVRVCRQADLESGPAPRLAVYLNITRMRLHNHLGLKHSDPESLFLCRMKWTKQRVLDEIRGHSATVVGHCDCYPLPVLFALHGNAARWSNRLSSIQDQVGDN